MERRNLVLQRMQEQTLITSSERIEAERTGAAAAQPDPDSEEDQPARRTSPRGSRTSSSTATGAVTRSPAASRSARRSTWSCRRRPSRRSRRASAASARARRSSRSTTTPAASGRWWVAPTSTQRPFNLATQGRRQPGSSFKPFTLIAALEEGISPGRTFVSGPKTLSGPRGDFKVENYEDRYSGVTSLATATTVSDNSVYAEVGLQAGRHAQGREGRQGDGDPHARLAQPRDGARRAQAGRDAARDGEVIRDARREGNVVSGSLAPYNGAR